MSDQRLRELERAAAEGDEAARGALAWERIRRGEGKRVGPFTIVGPMSEDSPRARALDEERGGEVLLEGYEHATLRARDRALRDQAREAEALEGAGAPGFVPWRAHWHPPWFLFSSELFAPPCFLEPEPWRDLGAEDRLEGVAAVARVLAGVHAGGIHAGHLDAIELVRGRARVRRRPWAPFDTPSRLTGCGGVMASKPFFLSPEQIRGRPLDFLASDVWSLGVLLYHALYGRRPFEGESLAEFAQKILREPPSWAKPLEVRRPLLERVCACALEKDPAQRYADAAAFVADLARARAGEEVVAPAPPPPGLVGRLRRWWRGAT